MHYVVLLCSYTYTRPDTHTSPPPRQQKGELVDWCLALQSVRLPGLHLHHLVLKGTCDLLEHLHGHTQRQVDSLVEGRQLLAGQALLVQPVEQVADLSQAGQQQEQVPGDDIQTAHGQPAPQGHAQEGGAEEAEDEEAPIGPAASHVAQQQDGVAQMVHGSLCVVSPAIADGTVEQAVQQSRVLSTHVGISSRLSVPQINKRNCYAQKCVISVPSRSKNKPLIQK